MNKSASGPASPNSGSMSPSRGAPSPPDSQAPKAGPAWKGHSAHKAGPGFRAVKGPGGARRGKHGTLPKLKSPPLVPGLAVHQKSLDLWQRSTSSLPELGAPPDHLVLMLKRSQAQEAQQRGDNLAGERGAEQLQSSNGMLQGTEEAAKKEALLQLEAQQDIASVSRRIRQDLDRTCGILLAKTEGAEAEDGASGVGEEYQEQFLALQNISKATNQVADELGSDFLEEKSVGHDPVGYDDPLLQKARQLSTVATKICEDLNASYPVRTETEEYQDVSALHEITTVTMTVKDSMARLQEESWACAVLNASTSQDEHLDELEAVSPIAAADTEPSFAHRGSEAGMGYFSRQGSGLGGDDHIWGDSTMLPDAGGVEASPMGRGSRMVDGSPASHAETGSTRTASPQRTTIGGGGGGGGDRRRGSALRTSFAAEPTFIPGEAEQQPGASPPPSQPGSAADASSAGPTLGKGEVEGLPSLAERLARVTQKSGSEISEEELERMRTAFNRFRVPGTGDLHHDNLVELLHYLGHVITAGDQFPELWTSVTSYDYMDFDEFMQYIALYINYEKEQYRLIFDAYDVDGSGEISIAELRNLTAHLGIAPRKGMMQEALALVDEDSNGQLGFDELMQFLVVYRHTEGFTRDEVKQLRRVFDRLSGHYNEGRLPMDLLCDALVRVFGPQVEDEANKLEEKLRRASGGDPLGSEGFLFAEFLVFARRVREGQKAQLEIEYSGKDGEAPPETEDSFGRDEFAEFDADNSGMLSRSELRQALFKLGYEPLRAVLDEVLSEVLETEAGPDTEMDLNQFFDFLLIYRQREGFLKSEVEEFLHVFQRFDEDGSEQINALELADVFRFMGHNPVLDDLHLLLRQVDENNTNELDFREFLKLMQIHRNAEIHKMRNVFAQHAGTNDVLSMDALTAALDDLGQPPTKNSLMMQDVDCDTFISVVDNCRQEHVIKQRKKAGFSSAEIDTFREVFDGVDKDGSGVIDSLELQGILKEFGWEPRTRDEQDRLVKKFDVARMLAKEAGIMESSPLGGASIKFWEFIQLARILQKERDREEEAAVENLVKELKFSYAEVDEFRQVFKDWTKPPEGVEVREVDKRKPTYLGRDVVRRIARTLGIQLTSKMGDMLEQQLALLEESYNKLNFKGFLRLMRWFLDTNVAGDGGDSES
mmetsp:Transcript_28642/g.66390  ORF Transcript_28642/g.66390 Transcript_28642/m.66390 type:complete len:1167 (-) Transcript_28642:218-3718(-)